MKRSILTAPRDVRGRDIVGPWPNANNTGCPAWVTLTNVASFSTTAVNQVIHGLNVTGRMIVNHKGVRFYHCTITSSDFYGIDGDTGIGNSRMWVHDCTITAGGEDGAAILAQNFRATRLNISGYENGVKCQGDDIVEDCYIHDLAGSGASPHVDGVEIQGGNNTIVRHNHVEAWDTSCVFIKDNDASSSINNTRVLGNRLINKPGDDTAFPLYNDASGVGTGVFGSKFINNILEAGAGAPFYISVVSSTVTWGSNRDYLTGATIAPP